MLTLFLTIISIAAVVGIMQALVQDHLDKTEKGEFFCNKWKDSYEK